MHDVAVYLIGLVVPIAVVAALAAVLRQERTLARLRLELEAERERRACLDRDFKALLACSRNLGDQLREQRIDQQSIREQLRALEAQAEGNVAVTHAAKLIDKGIELEEISRICELTRGEVELLSRLSKHRRAA